MKKEKIVSIVVPTYNVENKINECINSLINQSLKNIEIIFIDDGSSDSTVSILKKIQKLYPDKIVVVQQQHLGPSAARNKGIQLSKGKYIAFVDSDDFVSKDMYEKMVNCLEKNDCDLVACGRININENGKTKVFLPYNVRNISMKDNPKLLYLTTQFIWDKLYKKSIIDEYSIKYPENIDYAEDFNFLTKYKYYCNLICTLNEALYYYHESSMKSITNSCDQRWLQICDSLGDINNFFIKNGLFSTYMQPMKEVSFGYYIRRIGQFYRYNSKKLQIEFVKKFFEYYNYYFSNWKLDLEIYKSKKPKKYRSNFLLMKVYILIPNIVKWFLKKVIPILIKKRTFNIKKKILNNNVRYSYYRDKYKVILKRVFFMSYFGGNITDSPYYMMKELNKRNNYDIYVASRDLHHDRLYLDANGMKNVKLVKVHSKLFVKVLCSAEYIVNNSRIPEYVIKKEGQKFINTWHGTPLKTLGKSMNSGLSDIGNNQTQFLMCDYLLYPNEYTAEHIMNDFEINKLFTGKIMITGYPRNEAFFDKESADKLRENLNLKSKKVCFYMPTWRGETTSQTEIESYKNDINSILSKLDNEVDDDVIIYVKLHQLVMKKVSIKSYKHIKLVDNYLETYQFLSIADVLITDYSSVFFDFANTKKQLVLFMYDYDKYMSTRGMYMDIKDLPFNKVYDIDDLIKTLNSKKKFKVNKLYNKFLTTYCSYDCIDNSKKVNDLFFENKTNNNVKIIDLKKNSRESFNIYFISSLENPSDLEKFVKKVEENSKNDIFVIDQRHFTDFTNSVIVKYRNRINALLVVPNNPPFKIGEKVLIKIFRRTNLFKKRAKKIYKKELLRILPNINIRNCYNYNSKSKIFSDITKLYKLNKY